MKANVLTKFINKNVINHEITEKALETQQKKEQNLEKTLMDKIHAKKNHELKKGWNPCKQLRRCKGWRIDIRDNFKPY